nr:hypothetical protein [Cohnella sp. WQ 127256]
MEIEWIPTDTLENDFEHKLAAFQAIWTVPASPYKNMQGALNGIRFAREHNVPFLGTCGGFQHMVMLVAPFTCSVSEKTVTFKLTHGSKTADIYGDFEIVEQYGIWDAISA